MHVHVAMLQRRSPSSSLVPRLLKARNKSKEVTYTFFEGSSEICVYSISSVSIDPYTCSLHRVQKVLQKFLNFHAKVLMVQLLFICRNSDPKKFTFFTTRPVLLCKNETDKYFSMNSSGFYWQDPYHCFELLMIFRSLLFAVCRKVENTIFKLSLLFAVFGETSRKISWTV